MVCVVLILAKDIMDFKSPHLAFWMYNNNNNYNIIIYEEKIDELKVRQYNFDSNLKILPLYPISYYLLYFSMLWFNNYYLYDMQLVKNGGQKQRPANRCV